MAIKNYPFYLCFMSSMLLSCTHWGGEKLKSDWQALESAKSLNCKDVPLKPEDMRIELVHVLPDLGPSLLLEVQNRRGVRGFYHLAFRSFGDLEPESLVPLVVSQDSLFLGGGIANGKPVFLIRTISQNRSTIQMRDLTDNVVIAEFLLDSREKWDLGPWTFSKGVLRALVRELKDEVALDDQNYLHIEIDTNANLKIPIRATPSREIVGQAELFSDSRSRMHSLWLDRGTSENVKSEAAMKVIPWRAEPKDDLILLDDKGKTESWSFLESYDHILLASIKGDSLLWENVSLSVQRLSKVTPFVRDWQIRVPLSKVHVAQPLLVQGPEGEYLLLPQWLDHELSVSIYELGHQEAKHRGFSGIFKEGTSFHKAIYHEPSDSFYLLSKAPGSAQGRFSLCRISI